MVVLNKCKRLAIGFFLMSGLMGYSTAVFPTQDRETEDSSKSETRRIEEITVSVPRSLYSFRFQLEVAKERMYSAYNDANEDADNDVNCRKSDWTGTNIIEQICWPVFFEKVIAEHTQDVMNGEEFQRTIPQLRRDANRQFLALRENIQKVAFENPSVAKALVEFDTLEKIYNQRRAECMKKPAFLFLFRRCP